MLATVRTCAILGLEGQLVEVQVDIARQGLPTFLIVGLPDDAVREARERPGIRHFEGPTVNKPWHYLCDWAMREVYLRHRRETPWPRVRLEGAGPRNRLRRARQRLRARAGRVST